MRSPLVLALALALPGPAQEPAAPLRVRLFDRMSESEGLWESNSVSSPDATTWDFTRESPDATWLGVQEATGLDVRDDAPLDPDGGLEGGGLRLGPELPDLSCAIVLVPCAGLERVRVTGRVRLEDNPLAGEGSTREVARLLEYTTAVTHPARASRRRARAEPHRASRRVDPSGWDRFELEVVTQPGTDVLELQLLHRDGGSAAAVTRFDDVTVECREIDKHGLSDYLRERHRPRDGQADATPWRLRVELAGEVRDALLRQPRSTLAFPVALPPADVRPRLRFHYGMAPEAWHAEGDGARVVVSFEPQAGDAVPLATFAFDPKHEREHRRWLEARVDLTPVAGRRGELVFTILTAEDGGGPGVDLDPVLLATPRIEPAVGAPAAFNVLLIGVDTLRADRMSAFGYGRDTTPNLARLADRGVRFTQARSQAPWTLPSFSSILTSLYPSHHGAGRGGHDEWTSIDPSTTSLAEVLARVGYETQGIVANGLISPQYGLDQGFEAYRWSWAMESVQTDVPKVVEFVEGHTATPWLLFWHVMDPHLPYATPDEERAAFTDAAYRGRFATERGAVVPFHDLDPRPGRRWYAHEGPPSPVEGLTDADLAFARDYYDAELFEVDAAVGAVLAALERSGQAERTIVALVADHGEGLGDHGHYHHGYTLFDDQVHVPMILYAPGRDAGRVVERPVAAIDLAPTILGVLGLEAPEFFQGVDRLAPDAPRDDAHFIEYPTYDSSAQKAWVSGHFKLLDDPLERTLALYDLAADPGETRDVAAEHPAVVARARAELDEFRWRALQKGRFHLRVRGERGQRVVVRVTTDDLLDANCAAQPALPGTLAMDRERRTLTLDAPLERGLAELVFWGRGDELGVSVELDGRPARLALGEDEDTRATPATLARYAIPEVAGAESLHWPPVGEARLWLETGFAEALPVVLTPKELEVLRELGYAR